jgi:hypothetical protein
VSNEARTGAALVEILNRWQNSGAVWQVVERRPARVTVALLRCDGGEEVERLTSSDPFWLSYLERREGSED